MPHEMSPWVEGMAAAYVVAALSLAVVIVMMVDLPWWVKALAGVFWPVTLGLIVWSVLRARR